MAASTESRRSSSVRAKEHIFAIFEDEHADANPLDFTSVAKPEDYIDDVAKVHRSQTVQNEDDPFLTSSYGVAAASEEYENSEEDPFSETDEEDEEDPEKIYEDHSLIEEQNGFIGNAPVYQVSHSYDRSFSTTTAIHLEDPDHDYHEPRKSDSRGRSLGDYTHNLDEIDEDGPLRNVSETVSVMPEEYEYSEERSAGHFPQDFYDRTPLSQSGRYNRQSNQFSPSPERKRTSGSPTKERLMSSTHSTRHGSGFRNTSSVKNMQLSSPSPTPFSSPPRSLSKRYGTTISPTRHYTPSRHSSVMSSPPRQHHPEAQKEYPLVLLHCSISGAPIPYSQAALDTILPSKVLASVSLLREKLSATVIERGILVPHPGDDYELLEERVLESLELKRPRLGKCGHFNGDPSAAHEPHAREASGETMIPPTAGHDQGPEHFDGANACPDCGGHTCSEISDAGCEGDRRWNVKVYAANGLMRAGAWTAAWREMEKVDVEVGVFIPDRYKRELEAYATNEAKAIYEKAPEMANVSSVSHAKGVSEVNSKPIPMSRQRSTSASGTESASTAACARRTSRQKSETKSRGQSGTAIKSEEIPLSVLLERYVRRTLSNRPDFLLGILIMAVGIWFAGRGQTTQNSPNPAENKPMSTFANPRIAMSHTAVLHSSVSAIVPSSANQPSIQPLSQTSGLSACTFAASEASLHGMTAIPSDLAMKVLEDPVTSSSSPSSSHLATPIEADTEAESSETTRAVSQSSSALADEPTATEIVEVHQAQDVAHESHSTPAASEDEVPVEEADENPGGDESLE